MAQRNLTIVCSKDRDGQSGAEGSRAHDEDTLEVGSELMDVNASFGTRFEGTKNPRAVLLLVEGAGVEYSPDRVELVEELGAGGVEGSQVSDVVFAGRRDDCLPKPTEDVRDNEDEERRYRKTLRTKIKNLSQDSGKTCDRRSLISSRHSREVY